MRGYDRYGYEDLDEYEEDGEEEQGEEEAGEEEYEEEEDPQRKKDLLDYLELRQKVKEEKRKKLKKELGAASSGEKKNLIPKPKDNYGSFFGPSQPVIAQRVIQESKSLLENPNLAARVMKSSQTSNKNSGSASVGSESQANGQRPKVTNGLQTKVQMLKNTRDYSFLLSDDAELPAPSKDPTPRNILPPKSEARPAQLLERRKELSNNNGRNVFNSREDKKPTSTGGRVQPNVGNERLASVDKHNLANVDARKMLSGSNRTLADPRKQYSSNNGSGPGRPVVSKGVPSEFSGGTGEKKFGVLATRLPPSSIIQKPAPSKSHPAFSKQSLLGKGESQESRNPNLSAKQMVPPSKPKVTHLPPKNSVCDVPADDRPKKRPRRHDDEDVDEAISEIRKMFGYNPRRYADDDDDSDMEANFDDIIREEKRSAKIAQKEDEEELRKIEEEEERRERLRKEAKKRKMIQR